MSLVMNAKIPKRRVLIISFSFDPMRNPRAFRWTLLAERLAAQGRDVDVVTSLFPGVPELEQRGRLTIHRVGWIWVESLRARFRVARERAGATSAHPANPGFFARAIAGAGRLARWLWRRVLWPDASCLWYPAARKRGLELARRHSYDAMICVAPSYTSVLAGQSIHRRHPDMRWILDLGDPFSFMEDTPPNNLLLYRGLNRSFERAAFRSADAISVTTPQTRERYAEIFPESASKIVVIPPLLSLPVRGAVGTEQRLPGKLQFVYVGTLYKNIREPDFLLGLFAQALERGLPAGSELHFYGDVSACLEGFEAYRPRLGNRLVLHGVVARATVAAAIEEADVLINIGNDTLYQLPSKVVEYAATGKPVLSIAKTEGDSSLRFFAEYPSALGLVAPEKNPTADQVARLVDFAQNLPPRLSEGRLGEWMKPFLPEQVLSCYLNLLVESNA